MKSKKDPDGRIRQKIQGELQSSVPERHGFIVVFDKPSFLRLQVDSANFPMARTKRFGDTASVSLGRVLGREDGIHRSHGGWFKKGSRKYGREKTKLEKKMEKRRRGIFLFTVASASALL